MAEIAETKAPYPLDCEVIISSGRVSLDQLLAVYWRSMDPEEKNRSVYLRYYPRIQEMYENENGKIVNFWTDFHAQLATLYTIKEKAYPVRERPFILLPGKFRNIDKEEIHVRWGKGVQHP